MNSAKMEELLQTERFVAKTPNYSAESHHTPSSSYGAQRSKPNRRRARRACLACRARKVRCDVVERAPCGNCKWDNTECIVVNRRCGRYVRVKSPTRNVKEGSERASVQIDIEMEGLGNDAGSSESPVPSAPHTASTEHYGINEDLSYTAQMLRLLAGYTGDHLPLSRSDFVMSAEKSEAGAPSPSIPTSPNLPSNSNLPGFIEPLPKSIASDDLAYLKTKRALEIPAADFRNALIWSYFEYVYPFMPIVDLDQFLQAINAQDGSAGRISLLLFQAVLFAGTAHVEMRYLKEAGYKTRRDARKAFFQKVRLLYDFNSESIPMALIPAILLMSLWYESPNEHRNTWHWIDVAISQAFAAGFHRKMVKDDRSCTGRIQKLRRRIWWVCFMRDRLISLGMKRPPRIRDDDYELTLLEEDDFEPYLWQPKDQKLFRATCSYTQDYSKRSRLARLCIANTGLCQCLRYYLRSRYSVFSENAGQEKSEVLKLSDAEDKKTFLACNEDLLAWHSALSDDCRYRSLSLDIAENVDQSIALSRTILHMTYFAALSGIHRSRFALLLYSWDTPLLEQEISKLCMQHAALRVSDMAEEINRHGFDGFLPTIGLGVVVSAAAVHLLEVKGIIQAEKKRSLEGYRRCMRTIDSLTDMYVAADLAKDAIRGAFATVSEETIQSTSSIHMYTDSPEVTSFPNNSLYQQEVVTPEGSATSSSSRKGTTLPSLQYPTENNTSEASVSDLETEWLDNTAGEQQSIGSCFFFDGLESLDFLENVELRVDMDKIVTEENIGTQA